MELVAQILAPQNYEWSWWSLPPILVSVYFFALWLLIFSKTRFRGSSFALAIYSFSAMIWMLSYAACYSAVSAEVALVWCWNAYAGIPFIAVAMYHFTV